MTVTGLVYPNKKLRVNKEQYSLHEQRYNIILEAYS